MAQTRRLCVYGTRPPCARTDRFDERDATTTEKAGSRSVPKSLKDFIRYTDSDDGRTSPSSSSSSSSSSPSPPPPQPPPSNADVMNSSYSFVDYVRSREYGMAERRTLNRCHAAKHIITHDLFKERIVPLGTISKVFCSQWIDGNRIAFATKCNKIMVYNVNSRRLDDVPVLKGRVDREEYQQNGIYALKQNPSRSLLATGAHKSNEIAVYRLPSLDPIILAAGSHTDQIFDIDWLDDEFFVSVSRDNTVALWQVRDHQETDGDSGQPVVNHVSSTVVRKCKAAKIVRSVTFNKCLKEMITLSLNGYVHMWDVESFKQTLSRKLTSCQENVCMAMKDNGDIYAIGSRSFVQLLDARTLNTINKIPSKYCRSGIRSLSFQDNLITIGTGIGVILFYDIKAGKYLESSMKSNKTVTLKTSRGFVYTDEHLLPQQINDQVVYMPAIYTHCYDYSSTRLFCAGGPLISNVAGNYAGLWT